MPTMYSEKIFEKVFVCEFSQMLGYFPEDFWDFYTRNQLNMVNCSIRKTWKSLNVEQICTMTLGCSKCILEKVRTRWKQNIQKAFSWTLYVLPVRKILKLSTGTGLFRTIWIKTLYFPHTILKSDRESSECFGSRIKIRYFSSVWVNIQYLLACFG